MSPEPIYKLENLAYSYNGKFTLRIPDFTIARGASIGMVGPNGGGKSTLLRLLAFLESPAEGTVYFNGVPVDRTNATPRRHVTILLQEPYLLKRTVFENVAYGLKVRQEQTNISARVHEALSIVGLPPAEFAHRRWYALSGGEAQRVSLASRLVLKPEVLILDEPTASVDQQSALLIKNAITTMQERFDTTLIIASHDLVWLNSVTEQIYKIYDGRIVGYAAENLIDGPWMRADDGLARKILHDGQVIYTATPPERDTATALLNPSDIMLALEKPVGLSARNILRGSITHMTMENTSEKMLVVVDIAAMNLTCRITREAAESLRLLPGKSILAIFKASSLHWQ
jgi:tungstate transport system ATP-binding protein